MSSPRLFQLGTIAVTVLVGAVFELALAGHNNAAPLAVGPLTLVGSRDVDRLFVEDRYSARLNHTGPPGSVDYAQVRASLDRPLALAFPGVVEVVDGELSFGTVRSGETADSADTIAIRRPRQTPIRLDRVRWNISARPDLVPSDAWAGRWQFTMTYKDGDTGQVVRVSDVTGNIGAGAPVGFSLLPDFVRCTWSRSDGNLQASCVTRARIGSCFTDAAGHFELQRDGVHANGRGEWRIANVGECGANAGSGTEIVEVVGTKLADDAEPEPLSFGLITAFVTAPGFGGLIANAVRDLVLDKPTSERDCTRGGWHRFLRPIFRSERACRNLFQSRDDQATDGRR